MPISEYKRILKEVAPLTRAVRLNGRGESLIYPHIREAVEYARIEYPHLALNLFTSLSIKNDALIHSILNNDVQLYVSVDAAERHVYESIRIGGRFDFVVHNLSMTLLYKRRPFIVFTIQEDNIHQIYQIAEFALAYRCHLIYNCVRRDIGIDSFIEVIEKNYESIRYDFQKAYELYKNHSLLFLCPDQIAGIPLSLDFCSTTHGSLAKCPALYKELCILYDGTVTPCNMFNPYPYGNIKSQSLEQIWNGDRRLAFIENHKYDAYCRNCAYITKG